MTETYAWQAKFRVLELCGFYYTYHQEHKEQNMKWASSWDYGTFRPPYTHSLNAHAQPSSGARCLIFGRYLRLFPYFMCANSEGPGMTAPSLVVYVISTIISWAASNCLWSVGYQSRIFSDVSYTQVITIEIQITKKRRLNRQPATELATGNWTGNWLLTLHS